MSETTATLLDLGAEGAVAPHEYLIVAAATLGALVYLGRGVLLKRRRMLSGEGCGACGGCGGASACRRPPPALLPPQATHAETWTGSAKDGSGVSARTEKG